jgi:hypothetical protein
VSAQVMSAEVFDTCLFFGVLELFAILTDHKHSSVQLKACGLVVGISQCLQLFLGNWSCPICCAVG